MNCCDGTGWTGDPRTRCTIHYDPPDPALRDQWYYSQAERDAEWFDDDTSEG